MCAKSGEVPEWLYGDNTHKLDPFTITKPFVYMPNHITPRLRSQQGVFTIQPNIDGELDLPKISKYVIKNNKINEIKWQLFTYGITPKVVYPDIDGLCADLKWSQLEGFECRGSDLDITLFADLLVINDDHVC